ncbi:phospholipid-transporting ATPase ABCA1-like [Pollicipes pollicipes]|uniref:phospholipid-transporting ATPase ABCA1-like n=1 Tax=Pollicipes pollicipes TaxID=41117 RepID=UPI001884A7E4|nr:phospholipid-transporting ATPase ABCA1-like [Pollicipes pollicipes]
MRPYAAGDVSRASECRQLLGGRPEPGRPQTAMAAGRGGRRPWWDQLKAAVRRNITIKRRQKRRTAAEIFMPIYIFAILAIVRAVQPETRYAPVEAPQGSASVLEVDALSPLVLYVVPDGEPQRQLAHRLNSSLAAQEVPLAALRMLTTEAELEAISQQPPPQMVAGLVLPERPGHNLTYTLRLDWRLGLPTARWAGDGACRAAGTDGADGPLELGAGCPANQYYYSGFLTLQNSIDALLIEMQTNQTTLPTNMTMQDGPKKEAAGGSASFLKIFVPLYMAISLSQFITYLLTLIVGEKEAKLKDGLKLMGLRDSVYWTAWFLVYAVYVFAVASICIGIMYFSKLFPYSENIYIYIIYILYGWSLVMFGFMLSPFFTKAKVAGGIGNLAVTVISLLFLLQVFMDQLPAWVFWVLSLLSPLAFTFGIGRAVDLDTRKIGLNSGNVWVADGSVPFGGCILMICLDILLYAFLAFYLDNVLPNEYGRRESVFFIFKKSYWMGSSKTMLLQDTDSQYVSVDQEATNADVEPVSAEVKSKLALRVLALRKEFHTKSETVVAVDDLSLDMYEDQITAILGHNGAGKTTFFNMLTGLTMPTGGTATIYGLDITDPADIRELWGMIGLCPQHDILLDDLTPREHLAFLAMLRGVAPERVEAEVNSTLADVDLSEKADEVVRGLSGGQKRKLSVGQALIGDPRIVILDEPTAGVDPYSRRHMWSLLQRRKKGRLMLLTTHFMDEADILADRKAVVSSGRLRCCGSSMFLKNRFGLGYHLTVVRGATACEEDLDRIVASHVPDRESGRSHGNELSFVLPMASVSQFPELFADLEKRQTQLGVQSFGISLTTLEEVFLHLSEMDPDSQLSAAGERSSFSAGGRSSCDSGVETVQLGERDAAPVAAPAVAVQPSIGRAIRALLKVRVLNLLRVPATIIFVIIMPAALMVGGLMVNRGSSGGGGGGETTLRLGPDMYDDYHLLYHNVSGYDVETAVLDGWAMDSRPYNGSFLSLVDDNHALAGLTLSAADQALAVLHDQAPHSPAIVLNALNNGRLRALLQSAHNASSRLTVFSKPLLNSQKTASFDGSVFSSAFMVGFLFLLVPCNIAIELVQERELKIRNQLRVNGLSFTTYFMSFFIVMITLFVILWAIMLIVVQAASVELLSSGPAFTMLAMLYLEYTVVGLLFASICSYLFDKMETAMSVYPNLAMMCGILPYMLVSLLDSLVPESNVAEPLHYVFTVIDPFYLPCGALYFLSKTYVMVRLLENRAPDYSDYWSEPVFLVPMLVQLVQIPLLWFVLRRVDAKKNGLDNIPSCLPRRGRKGGLVGLEAARSSGGAAPDEDVLHEERRVQDILSGQWAGPAPVIAAQDLTKLYPSQSKEKGDDGGVFRAVGGVSFAVDAGEVFGLLGPNGAGKTTTMRMVIAEEAPTRGQIAIAGSLVTDSLSEAFSKVGYCPQFDAQWRFITVEEHLQCFAQIRGISPADSKLVARHYIEGLQVGEHAAKRSQHCSGGTRRKLSYALSMLGEPRIVLLDEPSTGMDPQSKRFLWDTIAAGFQGERGAILTTHSMEEADALCTRLGIMVRGSLRCLGSTQHLKNKYGGGYVLEMKLVSGPAADVADRLEKVQRLVSELFASAVVEENYGERLRYSIPQEDVDCLSRGFGALQDAKARLGLEEYSLSQTTLEQVFLRFAREQEGL